MSAYQILSKVVHAFGLQTPIIADYTMRRCWATAVAMATKSWGTCRAHDGMWPLKLRPSRFIDRRVMTFRIFSNMAAVRHFELKKIIFDHVTVIVVLICASLPNFIKFGSRVRSPDAHNCWIYNASLLDNGRCEHPICVPVGPLVGELWHFEYFPTWRSSAILNFKNFNI